MTRYFMTIPEAVQLVIQAGAMAQGGEIFVLDMGEPVKILDLAADLIRLHGLEPDKDIKIEITGIRPGEKLYEELFNANESMTTTYHDRIFVSENGYQSINVLQLVDKPSYITLSGFRRCDRNNKEIPAPVPQSRISSP